MVIRGHYGYELTTCVVCRTPTSTIDRSDLCEVLQGIRDDVLFSRVQRELRKFEVFETGGVELAVAAARNFRELRERGHTVRKTIDCLIAMFCVRGGHSLLHRDRDLDPFEQILGLSVIRL